MVRPHGTKGEVIVAELRGLPFYLREGMEVALTPRSLHDAEAISGTTVLARVDDLDAGDLDASVDELLGRAVVDVRYGELGVIEEVMLTPANDVWVVDGTRYGEVLIPVIEQVVDTVPSDGPISVRVMDGLIDPSQL